MVHLEPLANLESLTCEGDPAKKHLALALAVRTQFEFVDAPLIDIVQYFSEYHSISIRLDVKELRASGSDPLIPITGKGGGPPIVLTDAEVRASVRLRDALARICAAAKLEYITRDDGIVITTPEAAAESRPGITALKKQLPKLKQVREGRFASATHQSRVVIMRYRSSASSTCGPRESVSDIRGAPCEPANQRHVSRPIRERKESFFLDASFGVPLQIVNRIRILNLQFERSRPVVPLKLQIALGHGHNRGPPLSATEKPDA